MLKSLYSSERALFALSLFTFLYAAFVAETHYSPDEYHQIIAFAQSLLGEFPSVDLQWEFQSKIRPMFQPMCFVWLVKCLRGLGLESPFLAATLFRMFTAFLYWAALFSIVKLIPKFISEIRWQNFARVWTFFLWFLPWLGARPSSETWCAVFFFLGWVVLIKKEEERGDCFASLAMTVKPGIISGLLFCLSFESRFQIAFAIAGIWSWLLIKRTRRTTVLVAVSLCTFLLGIGLFTLLDSHAYREFTFVPWNYFKVNILDGLAAEKFGSQSLGYYFENIFVVGLPWSPLILAAFFGVWALAWRSALTWTTLPFILVHFLIGHKEYRFLFPMAPLSGLMCAKFLELTNISDRIKMNWARKVLFKTIVVINFVLLLVLPHTVVRREIGIHRWLYNNNVQEVAVIGDRKLEMRWYLRPGTSVRVFENFSDFQSQRQQFAFPLFLVLVSAHVGELELEFKNCELVEKTVPDWLSLSEDYRRLRDRTGIRDFRLFRCPKTS